MTHGVAVALVCRDLRNTKYTIVPQRYSAATGPDIEVWTGKKSYKIEVKVAKKLVNGGWQVNPLEERHCDMLAVVLPNKRIVYTSIKDHKKLMAAGGYRGITDYVNFFNGKL